MKRLALLLIPLLLVLAVALPGLLRRDYTRLEPIPSINNSLRFTVSQRLVMARYVRNALEETGRGREAPPPRSLPSVSRTRVFALLFSKDGEFIQVQSGFGSLKEGLTEVADALRADPRIAERFGPDLSGVVLRLEILRWLRKLDTDVPAASRLRVEAGLHGLVLQLPDRLVIQHPWDIQLGDWEVSQGPKRRARRTERMMRRLTREAGMLSDGWRRAHLYRFRTNGFIQYRKGEMPVSLYRGNVLLDADLGFDGIRRGLIAASDWLIRNQDDRGKFTYLYRPVPDRSNFPLHYGMVRHAGTAYGLFAAHRVTGDNRYLEGARSSMDYMWNHSTPPLFRPSLLSVRQNGISLLGASALALLALCEKPDNLRTDKDLDRMRRLAGFLAHMQTGDGAFYTIHLQALLGWMPKKQALYFPGESLLALARLHEFDPDPKWLETARRAAGYQIAEFQRTGKPDNWTIQGLARLYRSDPNPRYAEACFEMAEVQMNHQYGVGRNYPHKDYPGGFDNSRPPRSTPAASRTEALSEAYRLARFIGDDQRAEWIGRALLKAAWFILNQQYRPQNVYHLPDPARALGGIRGGPVDNAIRIDYNQHSIIALAGAMEAAEYLGVK